MPSQHKVGRRLLFPEKLWDLVHKEDSGIKWNKEGTCIEVERVQWEKSIGAKFRSKNYDSFIRQLHFYGFRKAGNSYYHDKFQRNQFDLVLTMKRKYSNSLLPPASPVPRPPPPPPSPVVEQPPPLPPPVVEWGSVVPLDLRKSVSRPQAETESYVCKREKLVPMCVKSPSKTLRKQNQNVVVKVGH